MVGKLDGSWKNENKEMDKNRITAQALPLKDPQSPFIYITVLFSFLF